MGAPGTTPGPWAVDTEQPWVVKPAICECFGLSAAVHNAHQIAASGALYDALGGICSLIGNVDHSRGGGENAARMYGQMLNDIRDIANQAQALARGEYPHV